MRWCKFIGVEKSYDGHSLAVRDLTLDVGQGEFLTLLGPSGSGKTTTLNMLAGFERPTRGEILLAGRPVDRLPPYERNIGMVFQNYALFPHMTVGENVAFPLSVRARARAEIAERVKRALAMVRLEAFAERRPAQLSGGQQQRVALARALVFEPSLVLMDEPLGALDKKLREQMQIEIKLLHERLGLTIVYVTHDQSEALTMSDRIAVFHDGQVMQQGTPDVLYSQPRDAFVAGFIGENNMLSGTVEAIANGHVRVALAGGPEVDGDSRWATESWRTMSWSPCGPRRSACQPVRRGGDNACRALVTSRIYFGDHQRLLTEIGDGHSVTVKVPASAVRSRVHRFSCAGTPRIVVPFLLPPAAEAALEQKPEQGVEIHEIDRTSIVVLAAGLVAASSAGAQQQQLTIASAGGAWQQAQHNAWYAPFAKKMGIKFNEEETSAGMARVEAMVQAHNVTDDVVTVDTAQVLAACDSGILVRLDWSKIAPREGFLPGAARDCGMGLDVYGDIVAYNTDVVKSDPPTSVLALFDTKRWPGKRGMQKIAANNLEWALEADGVPTDQG